MTRCIASASATGVMTSCSPTTTSVAQEMAALAETLGNLTTLFVKKGSTIFMVRVYGVPDSNRQLAIEKPIAQKVTAKV